MSTDSQFQNPDPYRVHRAIVNADLDGVKSFLETGNDDVNFVDGRGRTPLHFAIIKPDDDNGHQLVLWLIAAGADVNKALEMGSYCISPLLLAAEFDRVKVAGALIKAGADLDSEGVEKISPIHGAIEFGNIGVAEVLIHAGANLSHLTSRGFSPLHSAIEHGRLEIAEMLVSAGADVDFPGDFGMSPLHLAVFYGRETAVQLLIEAQANVNSTCSSDLLHLTPLMVAAAVGRPNLVQKLVSAGANVQLMGFDSFTALHFATMTGDVESCKILLAAGAAADPNDPMLKLVLALAKRKTFRGVLQLFQEIGICCSDRRENWRTRQSNSLTMPQDATEFSKILYDRMTSAGFNEVNATIQSGAVALLEEFSRKIQGNDSMFLFGSFSDGWGSSLSGIDGRVDEDSDIDMTFIDWTRNLCLKQFCHNESCESTKVEYKDGHVCYQTDTTGPNAPILSFLSNTAVDFIRAHSCCCYPPIKVIEPGYQTQMSTGILDALKKEVFESPQCHVVSAASPGLEEGSMRVSTTLLERIVLHNLTTAQGQLFILLKFLIKRVLCHEVKGLKTYIAKNLLFYMLDRTRTSDWQPERLTDLLEQALWMLIDMMKQSGGENVCMRHFFLRDASVYFKRDHDSKKVFEDCLQKTIANLPALLQEFQQNLKSNTVYVVYFQPFIQLFLWSKFPISSFSNASDFPDGGNVGYDQLHALVKLVVRKLNEKVSPDNRTQHLKDLLHCIRKIPDAARTARECLEAMARMKVGETLEEAVSCISSDLTVSEGIPCRLFDNTAEPLSVDTAKELVRKFIYTENCALKFVFLLGFPHELDFGFLPDCIRQILAQFYRFGYWYMNFEALKKAFLSNSPWPVIEDLREEFGDDVFKVFVEMVLGCDNDQAELSTALLSLICSVTLDNQQVGNQRTEEITVAASGQSGQELMEDDID